MLLTISLCIVWFYLGGSLFLAAPAFYVSDMNLGIHYAKNEGRPVRSLKIMRNLFILINGIAYIGGYVVIFLYT